MGKRTERILTVRAKQSLKSDRKDISPSAIARTDIIQHLLCSHNDPILLRQA